MKNQYPHFQFMNIIKLDLSWVCVIIFLINFLYFYPFKIATSFKQSNQKPIKVNQF
jgi:hypothetical protein